VVVLGDGFSSNLLDRPAIVKAGLANLAFTRLNFGHLRIVPARQLAVEVASDPP